MSTLRILLPAVAALTALAGCQRSYDQDRPEIQANYQFRHRGDCNSWVTSPKTGYLYCASPALLPDVPKASIPSAAGPAFVSLKEGPTDTEALRAHGEKVYTNVCAACHQGNGTGLAGTFPPLAGAGSFYGDGANHAKIIVHGLTGPITVAGQSFNGSMPPQGGALSDYDIAAVATFERTSWGNADGPVLPETVASVR